MITLLRVSGFALIDELELSLGPGLTVITGETGAGKSILVDALGLLRGARATTDVIRTGRDEARVEAAIELAEASPLARRMREQGRDADGELLVRRTLSRTGRGRVHLGGALATAAELGEVVGGLIDIASQHEQQTLTDPDNQLAILDAFADAGPLRAEMEAAHEALTRAREELQRFDTDARSRAEREDLLRFQLAELDAATLQDPDEEATLKIDRERLRHVEKFRAAVSHGEDVLYAGEDAAVGRLAVVARELAALVSLDPTLGSYVERLHEAKALIEDVAHDLSRYGAALPAEPGRLADLEDRLFLLGRLARKHGASLADAIRRAGEMRRELDEITSFEDGLTSRRAAVTAAEQRARAAAAALTRARTKAAVGLESRVNAGLAELALGAAKVPMVVEPREDIGPTGADRVRFLFAPNPGEPPKPLARIASGGELSRVMLAMKQALARSDQVLTYVFDEVDTGVGGATAEIIGRNLKSIARHRQVIVITHLPQVAVFADAHLRVEKKVVGDRTLLAIQALDERERTRGIARMLSGAAATRQASAHAGELLRQARAWAEASAGAVESRPNA